MNSYDVTLQDGFQYHSESELVHSKFIKTTAYSMRHMDRAAPVKEIVFKAMRGFNENVSEDLQDQAREIAEKEKIPKKKNAKMGEVEKETKQSDEIKDGKELMSIISMYCDKGDLKVLLAYMQKLLTCGICSIDDEVPLSMSYITDMTPRDFEKLCGEYIGNFIIS